MRGAGRGRGASGPRCRVLPSPQSWTSRLQGPLSLPGAGRLSEAGGGDLAARKGGAARLCRATL